MESMLPAIAFSALIIAQCTAVIFLQSDSHGDFSRFLISTAWVLVPPVRRKADVSLKPRHVGDWPRPCENSKARRARRNILEKLRGLRTDNAADTRLDAMSENCVFYISPMYEFSHSLDPQRTSERGAAGEPDGHPPMGDLDALTEVRPSR